MGVRETIYSHADLQALLARSHECMFVDLVSLESVRISRESYALLRPQMERRSGWRRTWLCRQLDVLSIVAGIALELHKVEHDLLPPLMLQEAKLEQGVLETLLLMKNSANALFRLRKGFKEALKELGQSLDKDLLSARVKEVGELLEYTAVEVLKGFRNIDFVQASVPSLLKLVNDLLASRVQFVFPDSDSE